MGRTYDQTALNNERLEVLCPGVGAIYCMICNMTNQTIHSGESQCSRNCNHSRNCNIVSFCSNDCNGDFRCNSYCNIEAVCNTLLHWILQYIAIAIILSQAQAVHASSCCFTRNAPRTWRSAELVLRSDTVAETEPATRTRKGKRARNILVKMSCKRNSSDNNVWWAAFCEED